MLQAIRVIILSAIALSFLNACGGESSGASSGGGTETSTPSTPTVNTADPSVANGQALYATTAFSCVSCHGPNGAGGTFPEPINVHLPDPNGCESCSDIATLAQEIANTMPIGNVGACVGSTPGSCAYDIAAFMLNAWIEPNSTTPPPPPSPGISITYSSNPTTNESGTTTTISFVLDTQPTADVIIEVSSDNTNEGTVSPSQITFNTSNWNITQSIVVTGVDDGNLDGAVVYNIIIDPVTSADVDYSGLNPADIAVTNNDNEVPPPPAGIIITPTSGLITDETGLSATFDVVLNSMPTGNVTIGFSSSDTTEGTVSPASITFMPGNFSLAQTITVTGVDDMDLDGQEAYTIMTSLAMSSDADYNDMDPSDVGVVNNDDELPPPAGVTVNPQSGLVTSEAAASVMTNTFTVVLQTMPSANVTIPISAPDTTEGTVSPTSLTFTPANWNMPQTVTVTGVNETDIDGDVMHTIVTGDPTSGDAGYNALTAANIPDVTVTNLDDDAFIAGKAAYELPGNGCVACHGAMGEGVPAIHPANIGPVGNTCTETNCLDENVVTAYMAATMPTFLPSACDSVCARNIAKYMLNNFSVTP